MPLFLVPITSKEEFESGDNLVRFVFSVKCALERCISYLLPGEQMIHQWFKTTHVSSLIVAVGPESRCD